MATYGIETVPSAWDDARDNIFFRVTAHLFASEFTYGAGVLLSSYDDECQAQQQPAELPIGNSLTLTAGLARS